MGLQSDAENNASETNSPQKVVIGHLGTRDDKPESEWRPTVFLFEKFKPDRYYLLYHERTKRSRGKASRELAAKIKAEGEALGVAVETVPILMHDPWDFETVFKAVYDFVEKHSLFKESETEKRFVHITPGTDVTKICWTILAFRGFFHGELLQMIDPKSLKEGAENPRIIDPNLSEYEEIRKMFGRAIIPKEEFLKLGVKTENKEYNDMIDDLERILPKLGPGDPILLLGETGVGKTVLAERIAEQLFPGSTKDGPKNNNETAKKPSEKKKDDSKEEKESVPRFKHINCAALSTVLVESELFGHVKGAFTDAGDKKTGLLASTNGGVLFLDEIGELDLTVQAKFLTAIDGRRFLPVGGTEEQESDYKLLICGTNRDLNKEAAEGRFRHDLLARIDMFSYTIPPLRERRNDIKPLLDKIIDDWNKENVTEESRAYRPRITMPEPSVKEFMRFADALTTPWPANLRDLKKILRRLALLSDEGRVTRDDVRREIGKIQTEWRHPCQEKELCEHPMYPMLVDLMGREKVEAIDNYDLVQLLYVIEMCKKSKDCDEAGSILYHRTRLNTTEKGKTKNSGDRLKKYLEKFPKKDGIPLHFSDVENYVKKKD